MMTALRPLPDDSDLLRELHRDACEFVQVLSDLVECWPTMDLYKAQLKAWHSFSLARIERFADPSLLGKYTDAEREFVLKWPGQALNEPPLQATRAEVDENVTDFRVVVAAHLAVGEDLVDRIEAKMQNQLKPDANSDANYANSEIFPEGLDGINQDVQNVVLQFSNQGESAEAINKIASDVCGEKSDSVLARIRKLRKEGRVMLPNDLRSP